MIFLYFSRWQYIRGFLTVVFLVGGVALLIGWVMNPRDGILYGALLVYAVLTLATLHVHQPVALAALLRLGLVAWSILIVLAPYFLIVR